jgi:hypothetical protein
MKKRIVCIIAGIIMLLYGVANAATYTLPEKMQNQLAIGSGLKGNFTVSANGEISKVPFLNAVCDAEYDLRGMSSGHDLHYYVFQENNGNQTIIAELYKKDGQYYLRSDIVQGKILGLSGFSIFLDALFAQQGENPTISSALLNYLTLSEDVKEKQWKTEINKYQNELEMWLHDFTAQAEVVKQENGSSAFDFSYVIPIDEMKNKMISMFTEFAADAELQTLLDTIMTTEQKELYFNTALSYFYEAAINSLDIQNDIKLSKRVSALGDMINSKMILPLEPKITGFDKLTIESSGGYSIYQLEGNDKALVIGIPSIDLLNEKEYEKSIWISNIDNTNLKENKNFSVRADIKKSFSQYNDEEDKSHQEEHYSALICQDTTYLPEAFKDQELAEWHDIEASLDLHYHSKYSQNSATTLEAKLDYRQNGSSLLISGKVKTAAPWLFMPFEVTDPIEIGPDHPEITESYLTDWISNALSMIHHNDEPDETETETDNKPEEQEETEEKPETNAGINNDVSDTAEAAPLPEETETGDGAE